MSISEKASQIKSIITMIVTVLPKFIDLIVEAISLLKEAKADA